MNNFVTMAKQNLIRTVLISSIIGGLAGWLQWEKTATQHDEYVITNETLWDFALYLNEDYDKNIDVKLTTGEFVSTTAKQRMSVSDYTQSLESAQAKLTKTLIVVLSWHALSMPLIIVLSARIGFGLG